MSSKNIMVPLIFVVWFLFRTLGVMGLIIYFTGSFELGVAYLAFRAIWDTFNPP